MSTEDKIAAKKKKKLDARKQKAEASRRKFENTMLWCSAPHAGAEEGPFVGAGASSAPLAIPQDAAAAAAQEATAAAAQEAVAAARELVAAQQAADKELTEAQMRLAKCQGDIAQYEDSDKCEAEEQNREAAALLKRETEVAATRAAAFLREGEEVATARAASLLRRDEAERRAIELAATLEDARKREEADFLRRDSEVAARRAAIGAIEAVVAIEAARDAAAPLKEEREMAARYAAALLREERGGHIARGLPLEER